ncbi:MAG TPA: AAA family ATPase [Gemmatimonadales bacterium]
MLEVALTLAEHGWPVFPCRPDTKQPLVAHGFKGRSNDLQQINRWWGSLREATVGIVPADGGLVALDVDSPQALAALRTAGLLPCGLLDALKARAPDADLGSEYGLIVATGGNSESFQYEGVTVPPMHWYLRANGSTPKVPGVVCRYDSGYVIGPGSRGRKVYGLLGNGDPLCFAPSRVIEPPASTTTPATPDEARSQVQRAPDIERVRQAVECIPNTAETDRDQYVALAHMLKGSAGDAGRDIFLEWAAKYPGVVDAAEDERVYETITNPRTGWTELWHVAALHGFDATPERQAEAQDEFEAVADAPAPPHTSPNLSVRSFADVKPKRIEWLLPGRVARQHITMVNGWPGEGKTSVVIDVVARMTRGEKLPDGTHTPRPLRVLFLSTEDGESILHLRLRAAGADMGRIFTIPDTELQHLSLPSHKATWVRYLRQYRIDVVVVDPMKPFLDAGLDDIKEQHARKFMQALRQVCEATNVAVICIRHPNKATAGGHSTAVSAASGSLAFTAAARIELVVGRMPDNEETRALAHVKNNLAKPPGALLYRIVSKDVSFEDEGSTIRQDVAGIEWEGVDDHITGDELLARREGREERSKLEEAKAFLTNYLASGPVEHSVVRKTAKRQGITERTLERALSQVGWSDIAGNLRRGGKSIWGLKGQQLDEYGNPPPESKEETALDPADLSDLENPGSSPGLRTATDMVPIPEQSNDARPEEWAGGGPRYERQDL